MSLYKMKRLLIIGSAGAGKSTFTKQLNSLLNIPVIHLDRYYWQPNWIATPNEEWDELIRKFTAEDEWIMDGNYSRTLDLRLERADAVIFMDMPRLLCVYRVLKRRVQYHGRSRVDLNEKCPEQLDGSFIRFIWNFKHRNRPAIMKKLEQFDKQKEIYIVRSPKEVRSLLKQLQEQVKSIL